MNAPCPRRNSSESKWIEEYVANRLEPLRSALEGLSTPPERTVEIRGRIAELKALVRHLEEEQANER